MTMRLKALKPSDDNTLRFTNKKPMAPRKNIWAMASPVILKYSKNISHLLDKWKVIITVKSGGCNRLLLAQKPLKARFSAL
jgi:ABC-type transport system substrate-binding protein